MAENYEGGYELPDDLRMMKDLARNFIRKEVIPLEGEMRDPEIYELPKEKLLPLQKKARDIGLWCIGAPEKFGGAGLSLFAQAIIGEEASQHRAGAYNPSLGAFGYEPPNILYDANPDQIERYVVPTVEGKRYAFYAITEPSGGSDPARAIRTRAVKKGDRWVLNGQKTFITGATEADYGVVFARTGEGRAGITAFIVDKDTLGLTVRPIPVIRPWYPCELFFEDVEIPGENVFGEVGQGFMYLNNFLVKNRVPYSAGCLGIGVAALRLAINYANLRQTFGSLLATKQAVQWMIADSEVELRAARWLNWEAAWKADQGKDARFESSVAKVFVTETAGRVVDRAIQIHGGMGVTKELPLERWYREMRIKRIGEGPSEIHRLVIARDLLSGKVKI